MSSTSASAAKARPPSSTTERPAQRAAAVPITDLLSYRLHVVANLLSRGAELRYRREFGVSLWEWRTVALLGAREPMSLNDLSRAAGIHKSQMSRVVSGLAARRLVLREVDPGDGRGVRLALSRPGRKLYDGLIRAAAERDCAFRSCLEKNERDIFERAMNKLADEARRFIQRERKLK